MTSLTDTAPPRGGEMTESPFLKQLIAIIRAQDSYGQWDDKSDAALLAEYIVTREERQALPIIGDPDPDIMWRIEKFYDAVGLMVEKRTGHMASQMSKMSHEGFGRVVLIAGRLVVLSKHLRDVHRFGFETYEKLGAAGDKLTDAAVAVVETFPQAAEVEMSVEEIQAKLKKLSMRATDAKMNLHDLSEELPTDWQKIPEVAQATYEIFRELAELRKALKAAEAAA